MVLNEAGGDEIESETTVQEAEDIQPVQDSAEGTVKARGVIMDPNFTESSPGICDSEEILDRVGELAGGNNGSVALPLPGDDPLGMTRQKEMQQLNARLAALTEELDASNHHTRELEKEISDMKGIQRELEESQDTIEDLEMQLQSVKEEFQRFRKQSEANAKDYAEKVESLTEQLQQQTRPGSGRHSYSRSYLESFPEQCDHLFLSNPPPLQIGTSVGEDTQSTDVECSVGHDSTTDELEENHRKIHQLTQSLRSMGAKQKNLQRRFEEAQDERDYLRSVMEDLQKQVDACSPEVSTELRARLQGMELEITRLEEENDTLRETIRSCNAESDGGLEEERDLPRIKESPFLPSASVRRTEEGPSEISEELVDCSLEIMGEMAHATSDLEIGISMSYIQYAGLLAAIQKAIKQLEASKESFSQSTTSFRVLDKSLSKTLSISRFRVRPPVGEGDKRLDALLVLVKEKESGLKFMEQMISDLRVEIKGHQSISLQQEVQLEYIKQQLSSSDKVISLTWEVENLKKALEESQRELKAQRDLNDQQQQELTIQWQSKQQAVAENLSQNHRVFSFSQQLDHVVEAKEALEAEKQELEEALEQARVEADELKDQFDLKVRGLHREIASLKLGSNKQSGKLQRVMDAKDCQELLEMLEGFQVLVGEIQKEADTHLASQKSALLQSISGLEIDCSAWKLAYTKQESEIGEQEKQISDLTEKLSAAESLRARAEQEKTGMQEILSLTSETTSAEILNLQTQLSEMSKALDKERDTAKEASLIAEKQILELQSQLAETTLSLEREQKGRAEEVSSLTEKFETTNKENVNLETRIKSYKEVISGLKRDVSSFDGRLKDLNKMVEQNASAYRLEKEKSDGLEHELDKCQQKLEERTQETSDLQERCAQLESLKENVDILSTEKSQIGEKLKEMKAVYEELQSQHGAALEHLEALKQQKERFNQERQRLEEQLLEEQQILVEARTKWEAEISALTETETTRSRWPHSILSLVQKCEVLVLDAARKETESKVEAIQLQLMDCKEREKSNELSCQEQLVECGEDIRSLQDTVENLQQEMKERESILQQEITETRHQKEKGMSELEEELHKVRTLYTALQEDSSQSMQQLKAESEQRDFQLIEVQAKAREMMKEKDEEIELLKQTEVQDHPSPDDIPEDDPAKEVIGKLQSDVQFLRRLVFDLTSSLEQSERTHELRNQADKVLKDELSSYERSKRREGLDMDYVKNVLVNAFEKGTLPKTSPMFMVLARLFEFSPEEMDRIKNVETQNEAPRSSTSSRSSGSIFSSWIRP